MIWWGSRLEKYCNWFPNFQCRLNQWKRNFWKKLMGNLKQSFAKNATFQKSNRASLASKSQESFLYLFEKLYMSNLVALDKNHWSHLDSATTWKIWKCHFFGKYCKFLILSSSYGSKTIPLFENISKNKVPRVFQSFGLIEDAMYVCKWIYSAQDIHD